jgi:hypothetical protein
MQQTRLVFACLAFALVLCAGTATAEEVIYFANGTSMPIRSHKIVGEMIHVDLGGDSAIAFPLSQVDKIEAAGKDVLLQPSSSIGNRIVSGVRPGSGGSHPVGGQVPSRHSKSDNILPVQRAADDPKVDVDASGVAVYRPFGDSNQAGKRRVGAAGHQRVTMGSPTISEGRPGSRRLGNRHVIGAVSPANTRAGVPVTGLEQVAPGSASQAEGQESSGDGDSSSSSGSDAGSGN